MLFKKTKNDNFIYCKRFINALIDRIVKENIPVYNIRGRVYY